MSEVEKQLAAHFDREIAHLQQTIHILNARLDEQKEAKKTLLFLQSNEEKKAKL